MARYKKGTREYEYKKFIKFHKQFGRGLERWMVLKNTKNENILKCLDIFVSQELIELRINPLMKHRTDIDNRLYVPTDCYCVITDTDEYKHSHPAHMYDFHVGMLPKRANRKGLEGIELLRAINRYPTMKEFRTNDKYMADYKLWLSRNEAGLNKITELKENYQEIFKNLHGSKRF